MNRIFQVTVLALFIVLPFATDVPVSRAADCSGFGYVQFQSDKVTVPKGGSVKLTARFQWTVSPPPASCFDRAISLFFIGPEGVIGDRIDVGTVSRGQDSVVQREFTATQLGGQTSTSVEITAEFFTTPTTSDPKQTLGSSSITLKFENDTTTYACTAADKKFACSPNGTKAGCESLPSCQAGAKPLKGCQLLANKDECGRLDLSVTGGNTGSPGGNTGSPAGGRNVSFSFSIPNPLKADDFMGLIGAIATWIFNLSIPIAVIVIIWAGLRFMWARGDSGEVGEAKKMLKYAVIGLVIIFIGRGFITLIQSILNLGAK